MSKLTDTIQQAASLAFREDAKQVVGKINGEWAIADWEDCGRISQMTGPQFEVYADGVASRHITDGEITEEWAA